MYPGLHASSSATLCPPTIRPGNRRQRLEGSRSRSARPQPRQACAGSHCHGHHAASSQVRSPRGICVRRQGLQCPPGRLCRSRPDEEQAVDPQTSRRPQRSSARSRLRVRQDALLYDLGDSTGRDVLVAVLLGDQADTSGFFKSSLHDMKAKMHDTKGLVLISVKETAGVFLGPAGAGVGVARKELLKELQRIRQNSSRRAARHRQESRRNLGHPPGVGRLELDRASRRRKSSRPRRQYEGFRYHRRPAGRQKGRGRILRRRGRNPPETASGCPAELPPSKAAACQSCRHRRQEIAKLPTPEPATNPVDCVYAAVGAHRRRPQDPGWQASDPRDPSRR